MLSVFQLCGHGICYRTTYQVNTPLNNPLVEPATEVEVTDSTHPLFGRRFPLLSVSSRPNATGYVYVAYREYITLRIPKDATNLAPVRSTLRTKLTADAVEQLISVAEECKVLCKKQRTTSSYRKQNQKTSGSDCPNRKTKASVSEANIPKPKSLTKCQKS